MHRVGGEHTEQQQATGHEDNDEPKQRSQRTILWPKQHTSLLSTKHAN
jgi:hypothetical protein